MPSLAIFIKSYGFYLLSALGIALSIKANIGISSFNAMNVAISSASAIKIGTITILINGMFLLWYMVLTNFEFKKKYAVQGMSVVLFGVFINFFTYKVLGSLVIEHYALRFLAIVAGTMISGMSVGMIVHYNAITFPIESVCVEISDRTRHSFTKLRYSVDIFSILVSISVSTVFALPYYVREGTIISLILFSFIMGTINNHYANKSLSAIAMK